MYTIVGVVDTVFRTAQNKVEYWNSNTWLKELVMSTDVQGFPYCERRNTQLKKWKLLKTCLWISTSCEQMKCQVVWNGFKINTRWKAKETIKCDI